MPVHDWTRVDAGIFHDFHVTWIPEIKKTLNSGLLPEGFYALAEQHAGSKIADVLTLHSSPASLEPLPRDSVASGTAVAEAPPKVRRRQSILHDFQVRRRTLAIRHVSGHRLVALVEIVSPSNKDRLKSVEDFADKVAEAIDADVHVLVVDLFPPSKNDPNGMHGAICERIGRLDQEYEAPPAEPLTLASYVAGEPVDVYLENVAVGAVLPEMPLFLDRNHYINIPLERTYQAAYEGMPGFWRNVLEGRESPPE